MKRNARFLAAFHIFLLLTSGAHSQTATPTATSGWWLPAQASTSAAPIDSLFYLILYITAGAFILTLAVMIYILIRYRQRAGSRSEYLPGNKRVEFIWTVIPAVIFVFLAILSNSVWSDIKKDAPGQDSTFTIEVRPRQFQWDVAYSGTDRIFGTPDDILAINAIHVPLGRSVTLNLRSQDVVHSFYVPEFRMKQDAVPGMLTKFWFIPTRVGVYDITCSQLCGIGHYRMGGKMYVDSAEAFDRWYAAQMAKKSASLAKNAAPRPPLDSVTRGGVK